MKDKLKILIIGSGGREHAVGWKISQSARAGEIFFAPGNAGTMEIGTNVDISAKDINTLLDFVRKEEIDLTLALPDDPLALGIVDVFKENGFKIWGPSRGAAELEWSKAYAKDFMKRHSLPTAKFQTFTNYDKAKEYLKDQPLPVVIKASGLALGKGVVICKNIGEALHTLEDMMIKKIFGEAGTEVVIEEFMQGPEISTHAFSDGKTYKIFPTAQDHKKIGEGDTGPNTGGMGTIAPVPFVGDKFLSLVEKEIIAKAISASSSDGRPFRGVLYPGLMLTKDGPKILEFNARFGDPETQTYMRLLETDLLDIIEASLDRKLHEINIDWYDGAACTIVLASAGYPGEYEKGKLISGINNAEQDGDVVVFHAGTKIIDGDLVTNGGRVLGVSARGKDLYEALTKAYMAVGKISFEGMQYRKDIGKSALDIDKIYE